MNFIDIVLVVLLITGLIRGYIKGFIFEIAVLGALFLGTYAAFKLAYIIKPFFLKTGLSPGTAGFVAAFIMFILVSVGIFFLAKLFEGLVNIVALGIFNKILGAIFGLLKYAFIASICIYFFNQLDSKYSWISADKKAESKLYYPLMKTAPALLPVMKELKEDAKHFTEPGRAIN